ncbi:phage tail protein [Clostridium sp. YIM B02555]|uniref:phage tail protein n=1 Tax=Clostridium sp. YIM B02555 TaxID=2911968 RepID=UPI001EEE36D8|nr:phage tail protein [Clostridium sp. YIM B02555]
MAEKFYTILTNIGKAKIANSGVMGNKVNFVKFKIGDGSGSYYEPTEDQKDLVHTVYEGNITDIEIDADNPNWMKINLMIPANVGGFMIREYGVFDAEGNMLAVAKCAESYKPIAEDGSTKELILRMILAVSNTKNISLELDPTLVFVTKEDLEEYENKINAQLSDIVYQTAGGTATALTVTIKGTLVNGYPITFIASANNSGAATTINGKKLYKPGTTTAPNLITGKAYTVWYNQAGDCFFIKASAEGDAVAANVLAGKKFSNDNDTGLVGTLDLSNLVSGNIKSGVSINGVSGKASVVDTADANAVAGQILNGQTAYINGNKVTGNMPNHSGADSPANSIAGTGAGRIYVRPQAGYYDGSVASYVDDGNYNAANIVSGKSILGLWGNATVQSLGGHLYASNQALVSTSMLNFSGTNYYYLSVTGLAFTPSLVIVNYPGINGYSSTTTLYNNINTNGAPSNCYIIFNSTTPTRYLNINSVTNGFTVPIYGAGGFTAYWLAFS